MNAAPTSSNSRLHQRKHHGRRVVEADFFELGTCLHKVGCADPASAIQAMLDSGLTISRSTPVRFSQQIVDSLETSADVRISAQPSNCLLGTIPIKSLSIKHPLTLQTDRTRAKDVELHIQRRVQQELQRLEAEQNQKLAELQESLKEAESNPGDAPSTGTTLKGKISGATSAVAAKFGTGTPDKKELDRAGVQKEIDALRAKLSQRKLKEEVVHDKQVEKAREAYDATGGGVAGMQVRSQQQTQGRHRFWLVGWFLLTMVRVRVRVGCTASCWHQLYFVSITV